MATAKTYEASAGERERIRECLASALDREPDIVFAYLYGGFLDCPRFHDIDVAVYFKPGAHADERAFDLARRLEFQLGVPVDVRVLNRAPVSFLFHVLRGRLLVSRDDEMLSAVMEETVRRYLNIAPLLRRATREAYAP